MRTPPGGPARPGVALLLCIVCALAAAACASSTVRLVHSSPAEATIPAAGAPEVAVVTFADNRSSPPVGRRSDGSDFMPGSSVADWVTHALATELSRTGVIVTVAGSEAEALAAGARHIVTGSIDTVWLAEKSATEYDARLNGALSLKSRERTLFTRSFSSALSRRVVPVSSVPQEMLSEALQEMAAPMARAVYEKLPR